MPEKILFIDDDRYFARLYKEALDRAYNVVVAYDAETAVSLLNTEPDVVGAVVDVMMPPPLGREAECHDGNTTGVWVLKQCSTAITTRRIALLVFTNLGPKYVKDEIELLGFDPRITEVCAKISVPSDDLPPRIGSLIGKR